MLYRLASDQTTATPQQISGRNLAHAHRSVVERALLGADLRLDNVSLTSPTTKQCSALVGVYTQYVAAAVAIAGDTAARAAVLAGDRPILKPVPKDLKKLMAEYKAMGWSIEPLEAAPPESLVDHFLRSSPSEWLEVSRAAGVDVIWSAMVEPLIA